MHAHSFFSVMAGLDPAIHVFFSSREEEKTWITGTSRVMTQSGLPAKRIASGSSQKSRPSKIRGRRECRARKRTRSLACWNKESTRAKSPQVRRRHPAFPARLVLTVSSTLSLVNRAFLPPSPARSSARRLDASVGASGSRGFAVRDQHIRLLCCRVHRIPRPTFVTIAKSGRLRLQSHSNPTR
jgi:hypothetical protein